MTDHRRPFPHNLDAERYVLGAMLGASPGADASPVVDRILQTGLTAEAFYRSDHSNLFELIVRMVTDGLPVDMVTVPAAVMRSGDEQAVGGLAYVLDLPGHCVSTANVEHYCKAVLDDRRRRDLIERLQAVTDAAFDGQADPGRLADAVISGVSDSPVLRTTAGWRPMWQVFDSAHDDVIEQADSTSTGNGGVSSGLRDLDAKIGALFPTDLIVLAARPGMGKTAMAMQIASYAALQQGIVGVFSLEMAGEQLARRQLAAEAGVSGLTLRKGDLQDIERQNLHTAWQRLRDQSVGIYVDDTPGLTISEIKARARRLVRDVGHVHLFVVDYLQLVEGELGPRSSREREVAFMARQAKLIAKELGTCVLLLSQLNRSCEQRADKRPQLSDLRESGAIEQDADAVLFVFRGEYYWPDDADKQGKAELIIAKNRHGPQGCVDLNWWPERCTFTDFTLKQLQFGGSP